MFSLLKPSPMIWVIIALSAALAGSSLYNYVVKAKLRSESMAKDVRIAELQAARQIGLIESDALKGALKAQTTAVNRLGQAKELAEARAEMAYQQIEAVQKDALADIARLEAQTGASCEDGINLIDRELGL